MISHLCQTCIFPYDSIMKAFYVSLAAALLGAAAAPAQSLIEHAAAAAGATAGVGLGKMTSNGIDTVLAKAANTGSDSSNKGKGKDAGAAQTSPAARPNGGAHTGGAPGPAPNSLSRGTASTARSRGRSAIAPAPQPGGPPAGSLTMPPPPTGPAPEEFARVKVGDTREVLASFGAPCSHVTIPDEGHFIEILSYASAGRSVGTIRLDNGRVFSVQPAR